MSPILIALDVDRIAAADALVQQLAPHVGGFKVGKQLFVSEGPAAVAPIVADRRQFYAMLDGLLYGDPASHGIVVDGEFLHPDLDLRIAFPDAWKVANAPQSVVAAPESGDAVAVFTIAAEGSDPMAVANEVVRKASLEVDGRIEATRIGGLAAAKASARSREG